LKHLIEHNFYTGTIKGKGRTNTIRGIMDHIQQGLLGWIDNAIRIPCVLSDLLTCSGYFRKNNVEPFGFQHCGDELPDRAPTTDHSRLTFYGTRALDSVQCYR